MFLLYINDIATNIQSSKVRLFADDLLLYRTVNTNSDSQMLQKDLTTLQNWSDKWQLKFNAKKCYTLHIHKRSSTYKASYILNGHTLEQSESQPYLGVDIQHNLKWHNHINKITSKGNQMLAFVRRNFYMCPREIKTAAYQTLVRPHLEYASAAWDPHHKTDILKLEMVQRRAARFVANDYRREEGSMTAILNELGWSSLAQRRRDHRIHVINQLLSNQLVLEIPTLATRNRALHRRNQQFTHLHSNSDVYKFSFWPRTISDFNSHLNIPNNLVTAPEPEN
jgi:hypothetical protein